MARPRFQNGRSVALVFAFALASLPIGAWAAGLTVATALSDTSVTVGDVVTLEIRATAQVDGQIELQLPRIDGLTELSRSQSEGTSISWTGAGQKITREQTVNVEYQVERAGKIEIPAIIGRVAGVEARSSPLVLDAGGGGGMTPRPVAAGEVVPPEPGEQQLFLRYRINQPEPWLGQEVLLDLEIFVDPASSFSITDSINPPELEGFWREVLEQPKRLERRAERVGARNYHVYRVWRMALYGLEAGDRTIEPATLTFTQGNTIFGGGRRMRRKSLPLIIKVKALPTEGRPADFNNNNVGHYELNASVDRDNVPAGKAVIYTVMLSGSGNIKSARLPVIESVPGFRAFPPTTKDQSDVKPNGLVGSKRAEILLMPEVGGRLEIPAVSLPIFDPEVGQYRRLTTPSLRVAVEGTPTPEAASAAPTTAPVEADPGIARQRLRPIRYRSTLEAPPAEPWKKKELWGLFLLPPLLFGLFGLGETVLKRASAETPKRKRKAAQRVAEARLLEAKAAIESGNVGAAHARFTEALLGLGTERIGVALAGLTHDQLRETLKACRASDEVIGRLIAALEAADYARFAPGALKGGEAEALLSKWRELLADIDALEKVRP
jgi:hypothetical protein